MPQRLFLLDGMALVYRAHFAFIARPILTSKGVNTSALYGFTQTVLDIIKNEQPTHLAAVFDTPAPTRRHTAFAAYKANREEMPEDLSQALPHVRRMLEALNVAVLSLDGYEADDIIATLACRAERLGWQSFMVTPDKDLGQVLSEHIFVYKPGRMGAEAEVLGVPEICQRWGIERPAQIVDVLALMGDASDNIPGVPGIGEKTAVKLIAQYGSLENLLSRVSELSGRAREALEKHRDDALLSKNLATVTRDVPCSVELESLAVRQPDQERLKSLLVEFEFNSIGRRLFGDDFKAGRGFQPPPETPTPLELNLEVPGTATPPAAPRPAGSANLKTIADVPHQYEIAVTASARAAWIAKLKAQDRFAIDVLAAEGDSGEPRLLGLAFSLAPHSGGYVPLSGTDSASWDGKEGQDSPRTPLSGSEVPAESRRDEDIAALPVPREQILEELRPILESPRAEIIGHDLKPGIKWLRQHAIRCAGKVFDCMVAHSLIEPEMRHGLEYLGEAFLGYSPMAAAQAVPRAIELDLAPAPAGRLAEMACERADLAGQLCAALEPLLGRCGQKRVFYEIESPLLPVLADMEFEGIKVDPATLQDFSAQLSKEMDLHAKTIWRLAGTEFNLNSPKQLGQVLFEQMKLSGAPKKTRTGQYSTDEQTLVALAADHEIVRLILEYRAAAKLKSTYTDALPAAISPRTGRIHTTFNQVATSTGRLNSQDPNLQNIPIRTERGQGIRKAFVARGPGWLLLAADYSQIELRIIAALSREKGMLDAFRAGADIHATTAARVYGVFPDMVTPEMRRKAKVVNFGIIYGISAFGLSQRLGIPRKEASDIIDEYFRQFPGIRRYMDDTIAFARQHGYVETITGRRRYIRDITSSNNTVRAGAERNAINAPVQGSAADLIKLAMINIHRELCGRKLQTRMLLQVHDELVFDLLASEEQEVRALVEAKMKNAIRLDVPLEVEMGTGQNWLEAH
jgi:DNA polymerase-1